MAHRPETLDDILRPILAADRFTSWCQDVAGLRPWTVLRLRQGQGSRVNRGTLLAIQAGLAQEGIRVSVERLARAIEASRTAAEP